MRRTILVAGTDDTERWRRKQDGEAGGGVWKGMDLFHL